MDYSPRSSGERCYNSSKRFIINTRWRVVYVTNDEIHVTTERPWRVEQQQQMTMNERATAMAALMSEARADTLRIFDLVRDEADLHLSPGGGFRPVIWHLAHIGVFEAYWLLQRIAGEPSPDERYERIFDPLKTPREESKDLPSRREMESYLARVREGALRCLEQFNFDDSDPLLRDGYIFHLVLEHERQHQETLAYLQQMIDPAKKSKPSGSLIEVDNSAIAPNAATTGELVEVPAGFFEMGSNWKSFAYDNELPAHNVFLPAFKIDRLLTTNEEYAHFIAGGGYERRELWSEEGWTWRSKENWTSPLYWRRVDDQWLVRTMFEESPMRPAHPVTGVSWHEAEAYAKFVNKRLPTEAEWEKAASWDARLNRKRRFAWGDENPGPINANFGNHFWDTTPVGSFPAGASHYGCLAMTGNVWEWTSDPFEGYEGFEPFPYPEYSEVWFDGDHRVLKGGSWATGVNVLRTSFRNFFRRHFRIAFAGIRCASD
ncbi:MAG: gamma-glutamyl hercynylcysteine S-oxide synthase [Blastocatellia bacterium]|jgi:iron(II)-dependent oxidoreductase|nr:gamma-glutamyl hercynylcysteine S-oxide synthase [Blastocatellia bacterium]